MVVVLDVLIRDLIDVEVFNGCQFRGVILE